jgi:MAP kinase interacting serine/threonine kinase
MFYFEEDVKPEGEVIRLRSDSTSSAGSTASNKSTGVPQSSVKTPRVESPLSLSMGTPTAPMSMSPRSTAAPRSGKKTPTKNGMGSSPNTKRTRTRRTDTVSRTTFDELYTMSVDILGRGAYAQVRTCVSQVTGKEYAVKVIEKRAGHSRARVIKEIETFNMCKDHPNVVQLIEYFEEHDKFYVIFEKMRGGPLLNHIQRRVYFTEEEAAMVTHDISAALKFLHDRGVAHRDVKPENVLCMTPEFVSPVKLCDLDLASKSESCSMNDCSIKTPELRSPVGSAEFMAPEVVDAFVGDALRYDKRCDMWSLGVIVYIMLCGYPPFYGECGRENCGWNEGEHCTECQESLFHRIQLGEYDFPEDDWSRVSKNAKDLIKHLLVKDAKQRFTADDVLAHNWLNEGAPKTPLQTPDVLLRNDSARDLHTMNQNFSAGDRVFIQDPPPLGRPSKNGRRSIPSLNRLVLRNSLMLNAQLPPCSMPKPPTLTGRGSDDGVFVQS